MTDRRDLLGPMALRLLATLITARGPMSVSRLATRCRLDHATTRHLLRRLADAGLARREACRAMSYLPACRFIQEG